MRILRAIPALCVLLLFFSVQCRATCFAVPHVETKKAPDCPLHKSKAPVEASCSHAPQWDLDDTRQLDADLPVASVVLPEAVFAGLAYEATPILRTFSTIPLTLRL